MNIIAEWIAPRDVPMLTDIEFKLVDGRNIMVSWESATFNKRKFQATGVSTTDDEGRVTTGNLAFLRENIESVERVHYLSDSENGNCIKSITFSDRVAGHYKSEEWTFRNPRYHHHI